MTGFDHPEKAPRLLGAVTVALTAAAGSLDAVTFFAFDGVFASTMTGNLILLGLDLGRGRWFPAVESSVAIVAYMSGLVVGTLVAGFTMRRLPWRSAVGVALTVELALLLAVGVGWYAIDDPGQVRLRGVLLVTGAALAMGVQAAALRYVGPSGTPTNFLTGTVTNWVSGLVELHRPRFDANSALRIVTVAVAAGVGAVVQERFPAFTYALPVLAVVVALLLMARVTTLNHGGLRHGPPQFAADPTPEPDPAPTAGPLVGRVTGPDGTARDAVLTLVDPDGRQVARGTTAEDGRYRLVPPASGEYTVLCSPRDRSGDARATMVDVDGAEIVHDVVLAPAPGAAPA